MPRPTRRFPRAFTLVELAAVVALGGSAAAVCTVALQPADSRAGARPPASAPDPTSALLRARASARQIKDATQIRNMIQGMVVFAMNNKDEYPLPSSLDRTNNTVAEQGAAKDTTANIYSIMVFNGSVSTELLVSPAESNPSIKVYDQYEFADPKRAVKPAHALWDPAFSADFSGGRTGHTSYAHLQPAGGRKPEWSNTFNTMQPVLGNRGPEIASVAHDEDGFVTATPASPDSNTYRIHGSRDSWQGNMAYNDAHVEFLDTFGPGKDPESGKWPVYTSKRGRRVIDTLLYDEPEDESRANTYIGIFVTAGAAPKDYRAIWD